MKKKYIIAIILLVIFWNNEPKTIVEESFYIANEAMSIMENVGKVGLPLPNKLQDFLSHFEKYHNDKDNDQQT